jgi:hypothetical protein
MKPQKLELKDFWITEHVDIPVVCCVHKGLGISMPLTYI